MPRSRKEANRGKAHAPSVECRRSLRGISPIDCELGTRHELGFVGCQVENAKRNVVCLTEMADRVQLLERPPQFLGVTRRLGRTRLQRLCRGAEQVSDQCGDGEREGAPESDANRTASSTRAAGAGGKRAEDG